MCARFMDYLKYKIKCLKHSQTLVLIIIYQADAVPKVSFFVVSDVVPNVYDKPCIYGENNLSMKLFKFETFDKV